MRRMDDFFIRKTLLESIKEDLLKREDEGMLDEDSHMRCMYACICSVSVVISSVQTNVDVVVVVVIYINIYI